jgi:hypothetical protein
LKPPKDAFHPLLKDVRHFYLKSRDTGTGFLRPYKRMLVDVVTSERRLDGALEVANALLCALTFRGHRVSFGSTQPRMRRMEVNLREVPNKNRHPLTVWEPDRSTVLYMGTLAVGLTLYEATEFVETVYVNGNFLPLRDLTAEQRRRYSGPEHRTTTKELPSGRLCLQAYCPTSWRVSWVKRWKEEKEGKLLSMVPGIVRELEAVGPELTTHLDAALRKQQEEQRQWEEQRQRWKEEEERARLLKAHESARQELCAAIAAWDEARRIETYFAQVLLAAEALEGRERDVLLERVSQARALLGGSNPLESLSRWKAPLERL